ncbi:MAG: PAS domain-containing protein [Phycisphaerae bacterium]|nr:PAS domain-containing protein [Phycisphaerae bacterium]
MAIPATHREGSIVRRARMKMGVRIAFVIVAVTVVSYLRIVTNLKEQALGQLRSYVTERGQRERIIFALAEDQHAILKAALLERLAAMNDEDPVEAFSRLFVQYDDGVTRNRPEVFDGTRQACVYIGMSLTIDADVRRRVLAFSELCNQYGPAWRSLFQDTYISSPDNIMVLYWPEAPTWCEDATADLEVHTQEYGWAADVEHDPARESVWTGVFYDHVAHTWMISCETPVDIDGRHIATIGHDITLNELLDRAIDDHPPGAYNIVFREDGRLIAHHNLMDALQARQGRLDIRSAENPHLSSIYRHVTQRPSGEVVIPHKAFREYLAIAQIEGPDWYFVTVYPEASVTARAIGTARLILLLGLVSLLIEVAILSRILRRDIAQPLAAFVLATDHLTSDKPAVALNVTRNDELGRLGRSFARMQAAVRARINDLKDEVGRRETAEAAAVAKTDILEREIRERRRVEEQLRQSEASFRSLVANIPGAVYRCADDAHWTVHFISDGIEPMTGYPASDFVGNRVRSYAGIIHPDDREAVAQAVHVATERGEAFEIEYRILDATGAVRWVFERGRGTAVQKNGLRFIEGVFFDVTERRQAEESLLRSEQRLKRTEAIAHLGSWELDPIANKLTWSDEVYRILGLEPQAFGGSYEAFLECVHPDDRAAVDMAYSTSIREGRDTYEITHRVVRKNTGEIRYVHEKCHHVRDANGQIVRSLGMVLDITQRVQIEELMIQNEKMLSVGGLAAGMAHEINNPLAGILQSLQVVMDCVSPEFPVNRETAAQCGISIEAIRRYMEQRQIFMLLDGARTSGLRAARIVENMLSFSRPGSSGRIPHDVRALLDKAVELAASDYDLKKKFDFRHIEIVREYSPDTPEIPCEATKIQQVILNLLRNGAEAMTTRRDHDHATPSRFVLRTKREEDMVRIEIEDNGPGMSEEVRKRALEPFFTTKEVGVGTGLGLSISYFIITEHHKGTMTVESTPGQGTKFIMRLPISDTTRRA